MAKALIGDPLDELVSVFADGRFADAIALAHKLADKQESGLACNVLAAAHAALGEFEAAAAAFARAQALDPEDAAIPYNLGRALLELERFDEAEAAFAAAISLDPDYGQAHYNRGLALFALRCIENAAASFRCALELDSTHVGARNNLAACLNELGLFDEAEEVLDAVLALKAADATTFNNLAGAQVKLGRLDAAEISLRDAISRDAALADAHCNLGMLQLLRGDLANGWGEYEWRKRLRNHAGRIVCNAPEWLGDAEIAGKAVFLHCEQGLGDTIQFIRYAPMVRMLGARVTVAVPDPLIALLRPALPGIAVIGADEAAPPCDFHTPLMSLPLAFRTRLETVPAAAAYLKADRARVRMWESRLLAAGFRIGVCWQGAIRRPGEGRFFPLAEMAGVAAMPDVRLISLHKGVGESQLKTLPQGMQVDVPGPDFDSDGHAFVDTAAVMELCDLVITADTSVAHVAGALGVPVWLVLQAVPEWRWLLDRDTSPWYPSMRLFRQPSRGDWRGAFVAVEQALGELLANRARSAGDVRPPLIAASWGEVIDKITILEIKLEAAGDAVRANVARELDALRQSARNALADHPELETVKRELEVVNRALWQVEDELRQLERAGDFGARFVELARSVYRTNDRRFELKSRVNRLTASVIVEEKVFSRAAAAAQTK